MRFPSAWPGSTWARAQARPPRVPRRNSVDARFLGDVGSARSIRSAVPQAGLLNLVWAMALRVKSAKMWSIYGFCIRNRNYGLGYILHVGVLGPLGTGESH